MRTFTPNEIRYLYTLRKRNHSRDMKHIEEPLDKPMSVEERKLRSNIIRKCKAYIYELFLAEICGLIPDKEMKNNGISSIENALAQLEWTDTFRGFEKPKPE